MIGLAETKRQVEVLPSWRGGVKPCSQANLRSAATVQRSPGTRGPARLGRFAGRQSRLRAQRDHCRSRREPHRSPRSFVAISKWVRLEARGRQRKGPPRQGKRTGSPVIVNVVRLGRGCVVAEVSRKQGRRTKTGRWRRLVTGTKALPLCVARVAPATAPVALYVRDSETESRRGCQ